jgi:hypothetical protein
MANTKKLPQSQKPVQYEEKVMIDGNAKFIDYAFYNSQRNLQFIVEAKRPSVSIDKDQASAFQIKRYG